MHHLWDHEVRPDVDRAMHVAGELGAIEDERGPEECVDKWQYFTDPLRGVLRDGLSPEDVKGMVTLNPW